MGLSLFKKIIKSHLVSGDIDKGKEVFFKIDQTLTQDATGTLVFLEFEAMGIDRVKTKLSVSYVDHNTLQTGFENPDDHIFLETAAKRYGVYFSRPGNGICHQVHLEDFAIPGMTLLGSDSHTPTAGGIGMVAIGAGGLDVAMAMAGEPFKLIMPEVWNVYLVGKLPRMVSAKDLILYLLKMLSVKGGIGKVFEYTGPGIKNLDVYQRATVCNMGAELGATTSLFPSDELTKEFLMLHRRGRSYKKLLPDPDAEYDGRIEIDLSLLEPLIAKPHMPDNVVPVKELEGMKIDQVVIGSCTNSSLRDLIVAARILEGKTIPEGVSLGIAPGSRKVFHYLMRKGIIPKLVEAGARILECACGPCIGMGFAPPSGGKSLRTFNRNFKGRSGTPDAEVYLCSAEVAAASALRGEITDPRRITKRIFISSAKKLPRLENMIIKPLPPSKSSKVKLRKGPNIKSLPDFEPLPDHLKLHVILKVGDNITTDDIMPAGAKILPYRSNIEKLSEFCFTRVDPHFPERARKIQPSVIVGGENYGQGSSREHAALVPRYLGVRAIIAKSFSRIHHANLINFGILPLAFVKPEDYEFMEENMTIELPLFDLKPKKTIQAKLDGRILELTVEIHSERDIEIVKAGGVLSFMRRVSHGRAKGLKV